MIIKPVLRQNKNNIWFEERQQFRNRLEAQM